MEIRFRDGRCCAGTPSFPCSDVCTVWKLTQKESEKNTHSKDNENGTYRVFAPTFCARRLFALIPPSDDVQSPGVSLARGRRGDRRSAV